MPALSEILAALSTEALAPAQLRDPQTELGRRARAALDPGEQQTAPWFLRLFIAWGTWIGAFIIGLFLQAAGFLSSAPVAAILGGLLLAGAVAVARKLPETVLTTQITWIFAIAGQTAILIAVAEATDGEEAVVSLAAVFLQLLVIPAIPYRLFRLVSAIALVVALTIWIMIEELSAGVDLLVIAVAGAVVALWLADVRLAASRRGAVWRPVAFGLSSGLLGPLVILALLTQAGFGAEVALFSMPVVVSAALGLLGLWVARTAFAEQRRTLRSGPGVAVVAGVVLLVLVGRIVPGLIAGLMLLMLAQLRKERGLEVLALIYIAVFLSFFYYNMQTPLLWKSLWVIATGAVLLALAAVVRHLLGERETRRRSLRPRDTDLRPLAAALALALLLPIWLVVRKEQVLAAGQTVLLELRPVDPRSLIQGDYMQLAYALENEIREAGGLDRLPRNGKLVVRLDAEGVARYVGVWDGRDLGSGEQLLRYRVRSTRWRERLRLGAESFFFEEGTAELYQRAKYGELKVDRHGEAVLVGLRDAERRPLGRRLH